MGITTQALYKQQQAHLGRCLQGLVLMGIGVFSGTQILRNGLGDLTIERPGFGGKTNELFLWLIEKYPNAEELLPLGMVAIFAILALIGLYHVVRGTLQMSAKRTALGKSILLQKYDIKSFTDTVDDINADLELEPFQFGSMYIGRHWILDTEAMRLENIKGAFSFDVGMEAHVLCCVDENKNIWVSSLRYGDERDKALEHLKHTLTDIVTGDKDDYEAFLMDNDPTEIVENPQPIKPSTVPTIQLPSDAIFSFVDTSGCPTPEYTSEKCITALRSLKVSQSIAFRLEYPTSSTLNEVFFCHEGKYWSVGMSYTENKENHQIAVKVELPVAEQFLLGLILRNRLPDFASYQ